MLCNDIVSTKDCLPILLKDREVGGLSSLHFCQGSEGPWRTAVLRGGSRVAEHMLIRPSAYETFPRRYACGLVEESVALTDALYEGTQG